MAEFKSSVVSKSSQITFSRTFIVVSSGSHNDNGTNTIPIIISCRKAASCCNALFIPDIE